MRRSCRSRWLTIALSTGVVAFALGNMHYATSRLEVFVKVLTVWAGLMVACLNLYWLCREEPPA